MIQFQDQTFTSERLRNDYVQALNTLQTIARFYECETQLAAILPGFRTFFDQCPNAITTLKSFDSAAFITAFSFDVGQSKIFGNELREEITAANTSSTNKFNAFVQIANRFPSTEPWQTVPVPTLNNSADPNLSEAMEKSVQSLKEEEDIERILMESQLTDSQDELSTVIQISKDLEEQTNLDKAILLSTQLQTANETEEDLLLVAAQIAAINEATEQNVDALTLTTDSTTTSTTEISDSSNSTPPSTIPVPQTRQAAELRIRSVLGQLAVPANTINRILRELPPAWDPLQTNVILDDFQRSRNVHNLTTWNQMIAHYYPTTSVAPITPAFTATHQKKTKRDEREDDHEHGNSNSHQQDFEDDDSDSTRKKSRITGQFNHTSFI